MLRGTIVALTTPFDINNEIDYKVLDKHIDYLLSFHIDGLLLLGTTAESESLSDYEQVQIVRFVCNKIKNRIPILVGISSNITNKVIEKAELFSAFDIYAYLVITPYYNKTNDDGLLKHFTRIADSLNKPIILYNVPKRTGMSIPVYIVEKLSHHSNIIGIKEASSDINYQKEIAKYVNENFALYSGDDELLLPSLSLGASGIISVCANAFPSISTEIIKNYFNNENEKALNIYLKNLDFFKLMFVEVSPIPIKYLLNKMGFNVGNARMPYGELKIENKVKIDNYLNKEV